MKTLSVVVLCYHAGNSIIQFFEKLEHLLKNMRIDYEVIMVANDFADSKDKTKEIVAELSKSRSKVKALTEIKQGMMGWDMMQGMKASNGNAICVIDGDGQFPIESIREAYELLIEKNLDLVKTYRYNRKDGLYRWVISMVYNFLFCLLYPGLRAKDINSKPKLISREAFEQMDLKSTDWFIDAEIMILVRKLKLRFEEIPIVFEKNTSRSSFVNFHAVFEFIKNLFRYRFGKTS